MCYAIGRILAGIREYARNQHARRFQSFLIIVEVKAHRAVDTTAVHHLSAMPPPIPGYEDAELIPPSTGLLLMDTHSTL